MQYTAQSCYHLFTGQPQLYVKDAVAGCDPIKYGIFNYMGWDQSRHLFSDQLLDLRHSLPRLHSVVVFHKPCKWTYRPAHRDPGAHYAVNFVFSPGHGSVMSWYTLRSFQEGQTQQSLAGTRYEEFLPEQLEDLASVCLDNTVSLVNTYQPHRIQSSLHWSRVCVSLKFQNDFLSFDRAKSWFCSQGFFS